MRSATCQPFSSILERAIARMLREASPQSCTPPVILPITRTSLAPEDRPEPARWWFTETASRSIALPRRSKSPPCSMPVSFYLKPRRGPQRRIDTPLAARPALSKLRQHVRVEPQRHLLLGRITQWWPPGPRERAVRRSHHVAADCQFRAVELVVGPDRRVLVVRLGVILGGGQCGGFPCHGSPHSGASNAKTPIASVTDASRSPAQSGTPATDRPFPRLHQRTFA